MNSLPDGLDERDVIRALAGWGIDVGTVDYARVGFGSYHWLAVAGDDGRYFVTVDDLDRKPWLGFDRDTTFQGLRSALDTALSLRHDVGLEFVVAPLVTTGGATVHRISARYSLAVFPFVDGKPGEFGQRTTSEDRDRLIRMLAKLHHATPAVMTVASRRYRELTERTVLDAALRDLRRPWTGGRYAEPARGPRRHRSFPRPLPISA